MSVGPRILVEAAIAQRLVTDLLADGWTIRVSDGGGGHLVEGTDLFEILGAMFASDDDHLICNKGDEGAWVRLVYGNSGPDVISDYTTNLGGREGADGRGGVRRYTGPIAGADELADAIDAWNFAAIARLWPAPLLGFGDKMVKPAIDDLAEAAAALPPTTDGTTSLGSPDARRPEHEEHGLPGTGRVMVGPDHPLHSLNRDD